MAEDDDATTVMIWVAFPTLTEIANGSGGGGVVPGVVFGLVGGAFVVLGGWLVVLALGVVDFGALVVLGGREVVDRCVVDGWDVLETVAVDDVVGSSTGSWVVSSSVVSLLVDATADVVTGLLMLLVVFSGVVVVTVLVVDAGLVVDWCDEGDGLLDDAIVEDSAGTVTATAVVDGSAEVEVVALAGELLLTVSPEVGATPQAETPTNRHAVRAASARRMSPR